MEELLGEGQAKSGAHGVPFSYSFFDDTRLRELTFYVHDHLGNTRVTYTVGCDGSNGAGHLRTLEHAVDYFPYGSILREFVNSNGPEKYLTTHHERDAETGLDYRGARYYDSDVARFLSLDPLAADYASWSPYNYVMGNPISLVDPDGRKVVFASGVSDKFKKDFAKAVERLNKAGAAGLLAKLQASDVVYTLNEGLLNSTFDPTTNTITWDSWMGVKTTNGSWLSPETVLMHEVDHAQRWDADPDGYLKDIKDDPSNPYDNKEEERVIEGSEQEVAKRMGDIKEGEVTRTDHEGERAPVHVDYYKDEQTRQER
ncbi:MAG: RHS repeat-associated core domain-containing protein [Flavobacteriales bacterium]|nr:RHS repeat-associated core domain-containing protein [Flavobacteriales bacterium]